MVQHLTNKHKICWALKYIILQIFVDIEYLLVYIGLKILQLSQDLVRFPHFWFCLWIILCCQVMSLPQTFLILTYIQFLFYVLIYYQFY